MLYVDVVIAMRTDCKRMSFDSGFHLRSRCDDCFKDVCLVDALRAHGFKVPYTGDGPFWAIADGNRFLQPWQCLARTAAKCFGMSDLVGTDETKR